MPNMHHILLISGVLFALAAYSVYEPMPDYVQEKAFLSIRHAVSHVLDYVGMVAEFLNLSYIEVIRRCLFTILLPSLQNATGVEFTHRNFAGSRTLVASPVHPSVKSGAALVYIHGGGWAYGTPEMGHKVFAQLVQSTGAVVFAVRYRLAPEHTFPAAFDDCLAATEAIFESAKSSGVDPSRIAIAGDSAGGQLAASVVQQLRRAGSRHKPKMQVLLYPVTQLVNVRTQSYLNRPNEPILKSVGMHNFISLYLTGSKAAVPWLFRHGHVTDEMRSVYERATGSQLPTAVEGSAASDDVSDSVASQMASVATDFRVSPLLGDQLEKLDLPPAHILACEFDPLFEDSVMYAKRLERSGVRTHLHVFRTFHGASTIPKDGEEMRGRLIKILLNEL